MCNLRVRPIACLFLVIGLSAGCGPEGPDHRAGTDNLRAQVDPPERNPSVDSTDPVPTGRSEDASAEKVASQEADDSEQGGKAPHPESSDSEVDPPHPFPQRSRAPSLEGGAGWINTDKPIQLDDLRGKFVVLDFWTYCCINCMHVLPELKKLEHAYPKEVVVLGVHSAKFDAEKGTENIRQAVLRYDIEHPVVNDSRHFIWTRYGVTGWPAIRVIDPEGFVIAAHGGEIGFETLDRFFKNAIPYYEKQGLLDRKPISFDLAREHFRSGPLRFPGKVLADEESNRLYISDSGHHRIVVTELDGTLVDVIGSGAVGRHDGGYAQATFHSPQGAALHGRTLYVADTENHLIRKIDLDTKTVTTLAGTGRQNRGLWPGMDRMLAGDAFSNPKLPDRWVAAADTFPLASPWALLVHDDDLLIAMAGPHQIWQLSLKTDELSVFAGDGREDITDGLRVPSVPPRIDPSGGGTRYASFAQPSGLATDGTSLFVADSEGSAIREIPFASDEPVSTLVGPSGLARGQALFRFGDRDGTADEVRLQHALGVAYHGGNLYVADTYNNKIKVIDMKARTAKTLVGTGDAGDADSPATFDEPAGISVAAGKLYVADTNNGRIRIIDLQDRTVQTLSIPGLAPPAVQKAHP